MKEKGKSAKDKRKVKDLPQKELSADKAKGVKGGGKAPAPTGTQGLRDNVQRA